MNIFQKILFPFSGPKTQFLENKWWHRLLKILFIVTIVARLGTFYEELQYDFQQPALDGILGSDIVFRDEPLPQGFELDPVSTDYRSASLASKELHNKILGVMWKVLQLYLISLGLQLVYFKGIIYIIYGNKGK